MKKQSFLYGAAVLAVASLLCKILSAVMKIPLDRFFLHEEGIAVYQSAYSIYNVFLAFCVTGIPIALSSLVASKSDEEGARLSKSTFVFVTAFCALCAALLFLFAKPLALLLSGGERAEAELSLKILAPALLSMGIISSRRGYFQGKRDMFPSAVSQISESFIKVVLGIFLCSVLVKKGISYGAFGAMCGVAAGALLSALSLEIFYRKTVKVKEKADFKGAMEVIKLSLPMTLGAFGFTGVMLIDSLTSAKILAQNGMELLERLKMFGYLTRANTVYNLPATVITAFTASAVPALSYALSRGKEEELSENALRALKLIFLVAFPCAFGMILFSKEILLLLYGSSSHHYLLMLTGVLILIMPYIQTTTAMLQSLGKVWLPIFLTLGAIALKGVLNFVLIKLFGIEGAPLATIGAFLPLFIIESVLLFKDVKIKGAGKVVLKITSGAFISCTGARLIYVLRPSVVMLLISIALAAALYGAFVIIFGLIKKDEFKKDTV